MKKLAGSAFLAVTMVSLAGCSLSSTFGLDRHVPDETQVVVRPPLTLPPDFDLVPPGTPSEVSSEHEAGTGGTATAPKKEKRGFFGRVFHGDIFGGDDDDAQTVHAPAGPQAPNAAPPADVSASPTVAPQAEAQPAPTPAAPKTEEKGFFGRLFDF
jgi:hypothetical protein